MATTVPIPQVVQPPPPSVPFDPAISQSLSQYLRNFSLWAVNLLRNKVQLGTAWPEVILLSPGGKSYAVTVSDAGALVVTFIPPGKGSP